MATKVKLRQKPISGNRQSLYLDFYPAIRDPKTGELTRREFLGLYLFSDRDDIAKKIKELKLAGISPGNELKKLKDSFNSLKPLKPMDRQHNFTTLQLAEQIRQKRENSINKPEVYNEFELEQLRLKAIAEKSFTDYFKGLADQRKDSNHDNWLSALKYFQNFKKVNIRFCDINENLCNEFKNYLTTTQSTKSTKSKLSQNSAASYFNKFKAALKQAFKDGYLPTDIGSRIEGIKETETRRNYLTIEELNTLIKTPCNNPLLKRAALFSALTGLRFSDIKNLTWANVAGSHEVGFSLHFTQQKTGGVETLPISFQTVELMGEPGDPSGKVFQGLNYSAYENRHLYQWIGSAGITSDITFHCFRHTYATLQLANGTDIYTVSKLLGHRSLKTTQIYGKILNKAKIEAAGKITLKF